MGRVKSQMGETSMDERGEEDEMSKVGERGEKKWDEKKWGGSRAAIS